MDFGRRMIFCVHTQEGGGHAHLFEVKTYSPGEDTYVSCGCIGQLRTRTPSEDTYAR